MQARTTAAWPLSWLYAGLIVYASLYPFEGWRVQGIAPWSFLLAPLPRYWTGFDVVSNVLGYAPLGFLCALAVHRTRARAPAVGWATLLAALPFALTNAQQRVLEEIRTELAENLRRPGDYVIVNYRREAVGQRGGCRWRTCGWRQPQGCRLPRHCSRL